MRLAAHLGLALGLLLLAALLAWQGFQDVLGLLLSSGWSLLLLPVVWFPVLLPTAQGWRWMFLRGRAPSLARALLATWIGRAVNNLLPVASLGGEIVKVRLLTIWGIAGVHAAASVMAEKAAHTLALACWAITGGLLLLLLPGDAGLVPYVVGGAAFLAAGGAGLVVVQRRGMLSPLAKLGGKIVRRNAWDSVAVSAGAADRLVRELYAARGKLLGATLYRLLALALHTVELWLACLLLGQPLGVLEALLLRSLTAALADLVFIIPNAYGIQEGAFIVVGALVGLEAGFSLALSLALRLHDLVFDVPGLLAWQQLESHRYFKRRRR